MKTKKLIISTLCICLLTNCTERRSESKTTNHKDLKKTGKSDSAVVKTEFIEIEEYPEFPGGEFKLLEFINKNIDKKIVSNLKLKEGKVFANFQIDTTGQIINLKIIRSYNQAVDSEFIRVLRLMPKWKSGKQLINGNVNVAKTTANMTFPLKIPYKYELNDTTKPSYCP